VLALAVLLSFAPAPNLAGELRAGRPVTELEIGPGEARALQTRQAVNGMETILQSSFGRRFRWGEARTFSTTPPPSTGNCYSPNFPKQLISRPARWEATVPAGPTELVQESPGSGIRASIVGERGLI
jgi:hypothetical protein